MTLAPVTPTAAAAELRALVREVSLPPEAQARLLALAQRLDLSDRAPSPHALPHP